MNLATALRDAAAKLACVSETARLDAELLMAHALGLSRSDMLFRQSELAAPKGFDAMIERRLAHEPVAYITGEQDFWDLTLRVTPAVLIPRSDSETLIEAALEGPAPAQILDLGTGSGALLLAALSAFPDAEGTAIDASATALDVARANAEALGFAHRAQFHHLSWLEPLWAEKLGQQYDLILCNPPYVESDADLAPMVAGHEPHSALFAGPDGLDDYRVLMPAIPALLTNGGRAILEIGYEQADAVGHLAEMSGLNATVRHDLSGKARALVLQTDG